MLTSALFALTLAAPVTDAGVEARIERVVNGRCPRPSSPIDTVRPPP
jgi:hypothetical protein